MSQNSAWHIRILCVGVQDLVFVCVDPRYNFWELVLFFFFSLGFLRQVYSVALEPVLELTL